MQNMQVSIVATSRARQQSVLAAMQPQLDDAGAAASGVVGEVRGGRDVCVVYQASHLLTHSFVTVTQADGSSALESALKDFFLLEKVRCAV